MTFLVLPVRGLGIIVALSLFAYAYRHGIDSVGFAAWATIASVLLITSFVRLSSAAFWGMSYVIGFLLFVKLRMAADEFSPQFDYPITVDSLFFGNFPGVHLQDWFYNGGVGVMDIALGTVYLTHFIAIHVTAVALLTAKREILPRFVASMLLMLTISLTVHYFVPTAPPWLAADQGFIDGDVHRIVAEITAQIDGVTYDQAAKAVDGNLFAAMPSRHTGFAVLVALVVADPGKRWQRLGIAYVATMCLALVYLGEHYVIDEMAGVAVAIGAWRIARYLGPPEAPRTIHPVTRGYRPSFRGAGDLTPR